MRRHSAAQSGTLRDYEDSSFGYAQGKPRLTAVRMHARSARRGISHV